ncbi:hypothetical protein QJQ45_026997 [Haematococcus lacustris]|nr:hypothetical protein QJQ45_026997 [Haematococcus lacustris]
MQDGYPLACLSKKLSSAERNYTTGEQELLALITACKEWRLPELEAPSAADTSVHYPAAPAHPLELADHLVHGYRLDPAFTAEADLSGMYMDDHGLWRRTGKGTVMVPNDPELREYILHEMHDAAYAGHVGITKTLERLSRVFYWDTMRADVRHYVTTCDACQRDKSSTLKPGGLLNPLSIPDYRWESVSMDLITKLPSASHGFDAICVFVDRLSKMVHFVPCKESMNAKGFARLFVDNVFKLHGLPKDMVSDRGPHFHNTFWHHVQKLLGMRGSLSSSYHPQSDGQTERYNRVLEEMLRHYISPTQADWPDYLSLAEFAVNNSWQESIKSTPFLVNTGQSPITPMLHSLPDKGRCPEGLSYATWWQEAVAKAKLCMQAAQQRQAAYANQDRRDVHYKVGQMVLLSTKNMRLKPGKAPKLLPRFVGPFKVLDLVGQVAVNLQLPAFMSRLHPVFHVSLIKPYTGTDVGFMPPPVEWLDEEPVYYVERLLDHRHVHAGKAKEYLVQWEGYDADHNTWEPRSNLVGCDKILAEYNAAHNLKQCESRGFTRGETEAPLEGEECKVRTSGRDCRFASSGLSRECEPSRDAGYTCSRQRTCVGIGRRVEVRSSSRIRLSNAGNRVIEEMLRHYIRPDQKDWAEHLPLVEFAINNAKQESTRCTPFYLNYGYHPRVAELLDLHQKVPQAHGFVANARQAVEQARQCLARAQKRMKAYQDTKRRDTVFEPGDMVLLSTQNMRGRVGQPGARKLKPRYVGPFRVEYMVGKAAVKLDLPEEWSRIHNVFHVSLVKPYRTYDASDQVPGHAGPPPLQWLDGEPENQVEKVVDHRLAKSQGKRGDKPKKRQLEFLVKWQGHGDEHNTWESRSQLVGCQEMLTAYLQKLGLEADMVEAEAVG